MDVLPSPRVIMSCSPHHFADQATAHYHTRACQTLIHGKDVLSSYFTFLMSLQISQFIHMPYKSRANYMIWWKSEGHIVKPIGINVKLYNS